MPKKGEGDVLTEEDFTNGTQVHNIRSSPPANPVEGQIYFDSVIEGLRKYDGSSWQSVGRAIDNRSIGLDSDGVSRVESPATFIHSKYQGGESTWTIIQKQNEPECPNIAELRFDHTEQTIGGVVVNHSVTADAGYCDYGDGTIEVEKTFSVDGGERLKLPYDVYRQDSYARASIDIYDGNDNQVTGVSAPQGGSEQGVINIDVSNISQLRIRLYAGDGSNSGGNAQIGTLMTENNNTIDLTT